MKYFFSLCSMLLLFAGASAQMMYYPDASCKVFRGSTELTLAWCGGFNNPQFNIADLNRDGLPDLVVYEPGKGISTFLNQGIAGAPDYRFAPQYALNFPPVTNYLVLRDFNCDNVPDLFHSGYSGFSAYRGYYNSSNQLCFRFYKDLYYSNDGSAGGPANAYNNPGDIPAIVDVDGDDDLDFLSYNITGGTINFYKNLRAEMGLSCDSIYIALKDRCWGKVYQGFYRTHRLQYACDNSALHKGTGEAEKTTHSGNTPCLFDWDMDGDMDYLDGSISFNEMTFLKNGKREHGGVDSMIAQDTMWQSGGHQISIPIWPAAFNVDIDNDGKKDLLIAPNAANTSENYKSIWYYKNYSSPSSPDWRFVSDSFLTDVTIDMGSSSYPALFDYDKDGKLDLFVGSDGFRQSSGLLRSRLAYFRNTSTTGSPSFTVQSYDFMHIDSMNYQGAAPAFGDINHDGLTDMIIGHTDGSLSYYKNTAVSNAVPPVWALQMVTLTDHSGVPINVGGNAAPFIYDVDRDGKADLVVGNLYGTLQYFRNISTSGAVALQFINDNLGGAKSDPRQVLGCYSAPFIGPIDHTGTDYLLMGSNSGKLYLFGGIASGDTTLAYTAVDTQYSAIDSTHLIYNRPGSALGVYGNLRSAPVVGDIDGDGELEMIVGQVRGGLRYYKRKPYDNSGVMSIPHTLAATAYPNPASQELQVSWSGGSGKTLSLQVWDMQGRSLLQSSSELAAQRLSISVAHLPAGVYLLVFITESERSYQRFTVIR